MITEAAVKMLDVTEAGVVRAAGTGMKIGAWLIPYCYNRECARLAKGSSTEAEIREQEEGIVRGVGEWIISVHRASKGIGQAEVEKVVETIGSTLESVDYADVFDPHRAALLRRIAPLHPDNP